MADIKVLNGESILDSTKKALGLDKNYDVFDDTIVMHINTVFSMLHQIGASPRTGFTIIGDTEKWSDFIVDVKNVDLVKSYMYLRVRLLFDPPTTSFAIDAMKAQLDMLEWRLSIMEQSFVLGSPLTGLPAGWWSLDDNNQFPQEANIGDLGINFLTGEVWRKG